MHTGERQAAKMRMAYLKSMLNQDISLFDTEASTGEVISAITSDIIIVQDALSEKVCICILSKYSIIISCFPLISGCIFFLSSLDYKLLRCCAKTRILLFPGQFQL